MYMEVRQKLQMKMTPNWRWRGINENVGLEQKRADKIPDDEGKQYKVLKTQLSHLNMPIIVYASYSSKRECLDLREWCRNIRFPFISKSSSMFK